MPHLNRFSLPDGLLEWVQAALGSGAEVIRVLPQRGATSSTLHRLIAKDHRRTFSVILRRYTHLDWLAEEPDLPLHEASSLEKVRAAGLPTPALIGYDPSGSVAGEPVLLMTCLPGEVNLRAENLDSWYQQQAEALIPIHALQPGDFGWRYSPYNQPASLAVPAWSHFPRLWEQALAVVNGPPPSAALRFIHRDYHPVNVLWQGNRLSGIVDWANACLGPACIDLSWSRANLAALYGLASADRLLEIYQQVMGRNSDYHPYWDLMVLIEILPGPPEVYPPWIEYGISGLTPERMIERADAYLVSLVDRMRAYL